MEYRATWIGYDDGYYHESRLFKTEDEALSYAYENLIVAELQTLNIRSTLDEIPESDRKKCFYYDKTWRDKDGCCSCAECYIEKCSVAVKRMTEDEKKFYGVN